MYALRSRRNILHKGAVDPNIYDLRLLYHGAQWILAEIIRHCMQSDVTTAGKMAEFVQVPISQVVEDFGSDRLVLAEVTPMDELLLLLRHYYPERASRNQLGKDMRRSASTVTGTLKKAVAWKLVHGDQAAGYKLTAKGFSCSEEIAKGLRRGR